MVQKKSPCEKIQNQIVKQRIKLENLQKLLDEEMLKGHNFLPPPNIIKVENEKQEVKFNYENEADDFLKDFENKVEETKKITKKRTKKLV